MNTAYQYLRRDLEKLDSTALTRLVEAGLRDRQHVEEVVRGVPNGGRLLAGFLNLSESQLLQAFGWAQWPEHCGITLSGPCALGGVLAPGVDFDTAALPALPTIAREELPDHYSLASRYQSVRDQGAIGSCTAFGTIASAEALYEQADLSEAFVYAITKSIDGHPDTDGSSLNVAMRVAAQYGACREETWPYREDRAYLRRKPSPAAFAEARRYKRSVDAPQVLVSNDVSSLRSAIAGGLAPAIAVPIFRSTYASLRFHGEGRFHMKLGLFDSVAGYHAMCAIGFFDNAHLARHGLPEEVGGGAFLVRNSWGITWAKSNPLAQHVGAGPGYAIIPYAFIAAYCFEALALRPIGAERRVREIHESWPDHTGPGWWERTRNSVVRAARQRLSEGCDESFHLPTC